MTDDSTRPKTLKDERKALPSAQEVQDRLLACQHASDYEAALVCASLIEHLLTRCICTKFVPLSSERHNSIFTDGGNAPLSTLSGKIKLAHALGLLGNGSRVQCERINNIRNHFAHHRNAVSFKDDAVTYECNLLGDVKKSPFEGVNNISRLSSSKEKYVHSALYVSVEALAYLQSHEEGMIYIAIPIDAF